MALSQDGSTEFGWLIEINPGPIYVGMRYVNGYEHFLTGNPNKALRFSSKENAETVIEAILESQPEFFPSTPAAVEHGWVLTIFNPEPK